MNDREALLNFTQRWLTQFDDAPQSEALHGIPSPCIITSSLYKKRAQLAVFWQPVLMEPQKTLTFVEHSMNIKLHPSAHIFYGTQYAGDIVASFKDVEADCSLPISLVQIWNDDDFSELQQNLIAHLSMQKKFKRIPTVFIATTAADSDIISINNLSGEIVKECLITGDLTVLAPDLATFLVQLI